MQEVSLYNNSLICKGEPSEKPAQEGERMERELVVTKANKLVEASYRLSVSEQRVMALLVTQIHPNDEDFKPYRFKVANLEKLVADGDRKQQGLYSRVKALTRGLQEKVLQIREPDGLLQVSWLCAAKYFEGVGEVELEFSPRLKPYLLQLQERFTSYKLGNVVKLRSRYSVRLYELLKQYESLGKRSFELAELRRILGLSESELARWVDFKRFVLEVAKRELPKKTDLGFSYTTRKHVRAVAWVDFKIWHIDHDKPSRKKASKKSSKKAAKQKPGSPRQQAEECYREHKCGTACDVQDLAALNGLPPARQEICGLCANHQHALFESGAA